MVYLIVVCVWNYGEIVMPRHQAADLVKEGTPPAVRLGAARAVLEIGLKVREAADVEQRLAALEAAQPTQHRPAAKGNAL